MKKKDSENKFYSLSAILKKNCAYNVIFGK